MDWKKGFALTLALSIICSSMPMSAFAAERDSADDTVPNEYELYPAPHEINYADGVTELPDSVNAVFEKGIDDYTIQRAEDALDAAGIEMQQMDADDITSHAPAEIKSIPATELQPAHSAAPEASTAVDTSTTTAVISDTPESHDISTTTAVSDASEEHDTTDASPAGTAPVDAPLAQTAPDGTHTEETADAHTEDTDLAESPAEMLDLTPADVVSPSTPASEPLDIQADTHITENHTSVTESDTAVTETTISAAEDVHENAVSLPEPENLSTSAASKSEAQLYVGIYDGSEANKDSNSVVDQWFISVFGDKADEFDVFQKTDSYLLVVKDGKIGVLGKDTDSAFYGLTTLKQIMSQVKHKTVRDLAVQDWADVASRGFIEGYYGNPWSTEDRAELMRWGGEFKLNSYFYAPKDDPKHNKNWWVPYTEDELKQKIEPLAKAGNESKCQFVFALHPFMNNAITNATYDAKVKLLKNKFEQVIGAGVRQIAVLADDAGNQGSALYIKLMNDLVAWVSSDDMQKKYPGLKTTIPFCPVEYGGNGLAWMSKLPKEVPVVMTGGKIWGEVTDGFTNAFYNNVKRGPYMWINWPCTDNSKRHLIMGGYANFLHPNVNPEKIQGIVLNPMQQSEPSKVAIFGNACYSWNIWKDAQTAEQAWKDSFKYVDHETFKPSDASEALYELSKHMINQNMDDRVVALQESVELAPKLNEFKRKLSAGSLTKDDISAMRKEFQKLADASKTYREEGNKRISEQIVYWLDTWDNITAAADSLMNALEAYYVDNDAGLVPGYYVEAQAQLEKAETHGFKYVNGTQYAEVGVQHVMPFLRTVRNQVATLAQMSVDPTMLIQTPISSINSFWQNSKLANMLDRNPKTEMVSNREIKTGDYAGVTFSRPININSALFLTGRTGNLKDTFGACKLEYTTDGTQWQTVSGYENLSGASMHDFNFPDLKLQGVRGLRMTATANNNKWLGVREIYINDMPAPEVPSQTIAPLAGTIEKTGSYTVYGNYAEHNLTDGSDSTYVWYDPRNGPNNDQCLVNDYLGLNLGSVHKIGKIHIVVGNDNNNKWKKYDVRYSADGKRWETAKSINGVESGKDVIDLDLKGAQAQYVRLVNTEQRNQWAKFSEFQVYEYVKDPTEVIYTSNWSIYNNGKLDALRDGKDNTYVHFDPDGNMGGGNPNQDDSLAGDYIGLNLGEKKQVGAVRFVIGQDNGDKWRKYHLEFTANPSPNFSNSDDWTTVQSFTGAASGKDIVEVNLGGTEAQYVRMVNDERLDAWVKFSEISVKAFNPKTDTAPHVLTNSETAAVGTYGQISSTSATLSKVLPITLQPGEYIGMTLPRISHLAQIDAQMTEGQALTLKAGANLSEMKAYTSGSVDARYIWLQNDTQSPVTFHLNRLSASIDEPTGILFDSISGLNVADKSADAVEQKQTAKLFDGNINTSATFARLQANGGTITYDLGQTREIRKIDALIQDSQLNFIRSGVIEVAQSKDGPWTTVVTIDEMGQDGNQLNQNTAGSVGWGETISDYPNFRNCSGTLETPVNARYLRIRLTQAYSHRWINLSEIIINDGEYIPINGNPTFVADPSEISANYLPSFIADGNITTAFRPNMTGRTHGSLTYKLSDSTHIDQINVLQSSSAISNAVVSVRGVPMKSASPAVSLAANNGDWVEVGTLTEPLTSIYTYHFDEIYEIRLDWKDVQPIFYEISPVANGVLSIDTTDLQRLYSKYPEITDTTSYSAEALDAYNAARISAKSVIDDSHSVGTQAQVNELYGRLNSTYKSLLNSVTTLSAAKENLRKQLASFTESDYTKSSWTVFVNSEAYQAALSAQSSNALAAIKQAVTDLLDTAEKTLTVRGDVTTLQAMLNDIANLNENDYTESSFSALRAVVTRAQAAVSDGASVQEIQALIGELSQAVEQLEKKSKPSSGGAQHPDSSSSSSSNRSDSKDNASTSIPDEDVPLAERPILSDGAEIKTAANNGDTVTVITKETDQGYAVTLEQNGKPIDHLKDGVTVSIPTKKKSMGLVAIVTNPDGSETVLKNSYLDKGVMVAVISEPCSIRVEDRAASFVDVTEENWFRDPVDFVTARGLFSGTSTALFSPNQSMNRSMLATVLYRLAGEPAVSSRTAFNDVSADQYYADAVAWAAQNGIVSGTNANRFSPNAAITREQLAAILYRYAGTPSASGSLDHFKDASEVSDYAATAMQWAVKQGIISGRGDGALDPKGSASRAEVAQMLMNFVTGA